MRYRLLFILMVVLGWSASSRGETLRDSVRINFHQSKVNLDTAYMDNASALKRMRESISRYNQPDSNFVLLDVNVIGGASPEGSVKFNQWLSHQRAARIFDYVNGQIALPDSLTTETFLGRDWEGLRTMVLADPKVPYQADVLSTLDEIIVKYREGEKESDGNLLKLKHLHGGVPYLYMYYHLFPTLRESKIVLTFGQRFLPHIDYVEPCGIEDIPTIPMPDLQPFLPVREVHDHPFYMALKSNMLMDALLVPELGIEFYLGKNISVVANWEYGWWDKDKTHWYWRMYGGDIALRWWFGKAAYEKPLTGHHIGIYGGVLTYDFELGGKGYMGGLPGHWLWDRFMKYGGVEYGYSLPIAKRLNIDFTIGIGYMGGKYCEYVPKDGCYVWQATKQKHWFGPTKAEISLVWLIGHGNVNVKKAKKGGSL